MCTGRGAQKLSQQAMLAEASSTRARRFFCWERVGRWWACRAGPAAAAAASLVLALGAPQITASMPVAEELPSTYSGGELGRVGGGGGEVSAGQEGGAVAFRTHAWEGATQGAEEPLLRLRAVGAAAVGQMRQLKGTGSPSPLAHRQLVDATAAVVLEAHVVGAASVVPAAQGKVRGALCESLPGLEAVPARSRAGKQC